ncbi:hypothetical protein CAPTEDRAFT_138758 [Capitella teleta]|uniref:J domain-containing protein n=1 Tax=Capitella teleta TaxID=283909 RepID=R7VCT7_CAPTE|nr:hypothetical protein CAPTEDRAFT_138758 [Capitella teleta]|eukprot:ELU16377.1 hypothetical protein CAPTEDRAFT_138758 [Capitella teleta]
MASRQVPWQLFIFFSFLIQISNAEYEGIYCGADNCYEVLDVNRDSTKPEITKAYRKLARKWHPDMHKGKDDKDKASEQFTKIANAYEVLKDEESRTDYDYMLDNPEEYYHHYYRYYKRRMAPKVDVRIVIAVTISIISAIQYWSAWNNYNSAISYFVTVPKYRLQAMDIAKSDKLIDPKKKRDRNKTKEELREEEENILKGVIASRMDIRGSYGKPTIYDILWVQLFCSPYYIAKFFLWYLRWIWKFTICREEYGDEEKAYVMRKNMKLSQGQWEALEDHDKDQFFHQELWIASNFMEWKERKEEEMKAELANNTRHKMYRRYLKRGGPGQMSFGPD